MHCKMTATRRYVSTWIFLLLQTAIVAASRAHQDRDTSSIRRLQLDTIEENNEFLGIPGTTQTINGYDTALGTDAICWKGAAADLVETNATATTNGTDATVTQTDAVDMLVRTVFPNPLVENFTLLGETEILSRCPKGNLVRVEKPEESLRGERLRTFEWYNYSLQVEIDLDTLSGDYIVTDDGNATIALQVVVCSLGKSGFCSPFVHEQANAREAIDKHNSGQEIVTTKKKVKGDLHGGTHIHSPWVFLDLGDNRTCSANVTIPMIVNHPGEYFVIGTVQLYTGYNGTNAYRWDIANALQSGDGRYLLYQDPPEIMEVSKSVLIFSYCAIGIAGAVILLLIAQTIRHRGHQVLQLSQGDFLLVFLLCALISTVGAFLFNPKSDIYCRIANPIVLIPIQLMYAITVGRMWRIHAVISPLLLEHLSKGSPGPLQRFVQAITYISFKLHNLFVCSKEKKRQSSSGAKQQISQFQLALVVSIFTLPQVVLQIVALVVQPQSLQIDFNQDESVGRQTCGSGAQWHNSLVLYGFFLLLLLVIILMVMAHSSRKLPSLFNETSVIYDSTFLSVVLLLLGGAVIALTNGPDTSPDVQYLVSLVLVLSITLNSAVRIMVPKLQKVWKNETVIVSKLVTDHHRRQREKAAERSSVIRGSAVHVSGIDMSNSNKYQESFTRHGDYDPGQTNRLMTIHSCSDDNAFRSGRSSVESIEEPKSNPFHHTSHGNQGDRETFILNQLEPDGATSTHLDVIKEKPSQEGSSSKMRRNGVHSGRVSSTDQTSTTEMDVESRGSGSSPGHTAPNVAPFGEVDNNDDHDDEIATVAHVDDGMEPTDNEHDLEAGKTGKATRKKSNFFEQPASKFLKSAMAKGMSWRIKSDRSVQDDADLSDRGEDSKRKQENGKESERNKESMPKPKKKLQKTIIVTEDETPARRLVLKMLDLQDQLEAVNNKIMSGLAVSQEDWGVITKLTSKLDRTFNEEVEFEWDIEKRYEETLKEVMPMDMSGRSWGTSGDLSTPKRGSDKRDPPKKGSLEEQLAAVPKKGKMSKLKSARLKGIQRKTSKDSAQHTDLLGAGSTHSIQSFASDHYTSVGDLPQQKAPPPSHLSLAPPAVEGYPLESAAAPLESFPVGSSSVQPPTSEPLPSPLPPASPALQNPATSLLAAASPMSRDVSHISRFVDDDDDKYFM